MGSLKFFIDVLFSQMLVHGVLQSQLQLTQCCW